MTFTLKSKISENLKNELMCLDNLTEIFSFFTFTDITLSSQVCKWWNDLLWKDAMIVSYVKKNISFEDEFCQNLEKISYLGYLPILKWIHDLDLSQDLNLCHIIRSGSLSCLAWAYNIMHEKCGETIQLPYHACRTAAKYGHLKMLKALRTRDASWGGTWLCSDFHSIENKEVREYIQNLPYGEGPKSECLCSSNPEEEDYWGVIVERHETMIDSI